MSCEAKKLVKPVLSGYCHRKVIQDVLMAVASGLSTGLVCYFLHLGPLKERYAEFYRNYDAYAEFEKIVATGVLDSCKVAKKK